jgi:hypothetical protein
MLATAFSMGWSIWIMHQRTLRVMFSIAITLSTLAIVFANTLVGVASAIVGLAGWLVFFMPFALPAGGVPSRERSFGIYPRLLFKLPVRTRTLVAWPTAFGIVSLTLLWMVVSTYLLHFHHLKFPVLLPSLALAAWIVSMQAAIWAPIDNLVLQCPIFFVAFYGPGALIGWHFWKGDLSVFAVAAILIGWLMVAYTVALSGVAAARRGDQWLAEIRVPRFRRAARALSQPPPFATRSRAQLWYLQHSPPNFSPWFVATMEVVQYFVILGVSRWPPEFLSPHLFLLSLAPGLQLVSTFLPSVATDPAPSFRLNGEMLQSEGLNGQIAFLLGRPVSSGSLAACYFRFQLRGAGKACIGLAVAILSPCGFLWWACYASGFIDGPRPVQWLREVADLFPGVQSLSLIVLSAMTIFATAWKLSTDGLMVSVARLQSWRLCVTVATALGAVKILLLVTLSLIFDPPGFAEFAPILAVLIAGVIFVKLCIAAFAYRAVFKSKVIEPGITFPGVLTWLAFLVAAMGLAALLSAKVPGPVPAIILYPGVFAVVPLGRFALLPLMIEQGRHR